MHVAGTERRRAVRDPYALSPDRAAEPDLDDERDLDWVRYDGDLRMWTGPFAMAGINTRVVRRSNALQGWAYGRHFRYREVTGFGAGPAAPALATAASAAFKAAEAGLAFGPSRALLSQLLPAPGQGPGEKIRRTGYFRIQIHTRTSAGARLSRDHRAWAALRAWFTFTMWEGIATKSESCSGGSPWDSRPYLSRSEHGSDLVSWCAWRDSNPRPAA